LVLGIERLQQTLAFEPLLVEKTGLISSSSIAQNCHHWEEKKIDEKQKKKASRKQPVWPGPSFLATSTAAQTFRAEDAPTNKPSSSNRRKTM
jgi:hypothetical protein